MYQNLPCKESSIVETRVSLDQEIGGTTHNFPFAPGTVFDQNTEEQGVIRNEGHSGGRGFCDLLRLGEGRGDTEVPKRQRGSFYDQ